MKNIVLVIFFLLMFPILRADLISDKVYKKNTALDTSCYNQLHLKLRSLGFFKNNEFAGGYAKGYTLPGFWISPRLAYYPAKNVKLEAGAHLLAYWGTQLYPVGIYKNIPDWNTNKHSTAFHALPYFRVHWAALPNFDVVVGDIYGGANHNLSEPLYYPEMNLTADPEAGAQLLFRSSVFEGDLWINWESFIFNGSPYQEMFTVGLSSKFNLLKSDSNFELSIPIQWLAHHRGGEIDSLEGSTVTTSMNFAGGIRFAYRPNSSVVKRLQFETLGLFFCKDGEKMYARDIKKGWAVYPSLSMDIWDLQARVSYWKCDNFISLMGSPFYNSVTYNGDVLNGSQNISASLQYCKEINKCVALGADVSLYYTLFTTGTNRKGESIDNPAATSYTFGVYVRVNPDFLLYSFNKNKKKD
ncbi:MAG: hypothetical protein PUB21_06480 [Bacteroidales bacterium]|nr:hypothetical protein [Bacteroidales bacterium]